MGIAGSDCIQYFAGKLFGRTKIVPKISPNKSLEGYLAGVALCNAIYFGWLADYSVVSFTQGAVYVNGMLIAGILGDLFISWWKRNHHIKDTSTLLLAHGGFLDRCVFFFLVARRLHRPANSILSRAVSGSTRTLARGCGRSASSSTTTSSLASSSRRWTMAGSSS